MHPPLTRAIITAAGRGTRQYPATITLQKEMIPLVDRDGLCKPVLQLIVEEALDSGIEQVCVVVAPGGELVLQRHFHEPDAAELSSLAGNPAALAAATRLGELSRALSYALQPEPLGFGDAVLCAREVIGNRPFLLLLGDHVYLSSESRRCARQLLDLWERYHCPIFGVARTPASLLHLYGTVAAAPLPGAEEVYEVRALVEKPSPEQAAAELRTPGLPDDTYLCFFGMHVLTPDIFDCLEEQRREDARERGEFQFTSAQERLRRRRRCLAAELRGSCHDMGTPAGLIETQTALALHSPLAGVVRQALHQAEAESCG